MKMNSSKSFEKYEWAYLQYIKRESPSLFINTDAWAEGGDSSVVRAPDSWLKGRGFESLQDRLSALTLISVSVPPPCKRSPKCRWQVTAKHAYTLRMWLCMKWHGVWLYGVHSTCAKTASVSCGTSHASAVSTPLRRIFKKRAIKKKPVTHAEPHASAVSLLKRAENSAI